MNKFEGVAKPLMWLVAILISAFMVGCGGQGQDPILGGGGEGVSTGPTVTLTVPANADTGVQINRRITARFSVAMDAATINADNFKVIGPLSTAVAGTLTYAGQTAIFSPTSALVVNSLYTVTVTTGVKSQLGVAMEVNHVWSFTTGTTADTTAPTLISFGAADGATGVPINRQPTAIFSEPMDPFTLASPATSFTVKEFVSGRSVAGVVSYAGNTAKFIPTSNFLPNTKYTSTITVAAKDLAGNALVAGLYANPSSWTTAATVVALPPSVTTTTPLNLDTGVQINRRISATFSETMDSATISTSTFKVMGPLATSVAGSVTYAGETAVFTPTSALAANSLYTATITTLVKNSAEVAMAANYIWSFTTGPSSDTTAPKIISTGAANNAIGLPINRNSTVTFSEPMDPLTLSSPATNFTVCDAGTGVTAAACGAQVVGAVTYLGNTATFNPISDLSSNNWYTVTISPGAKDLAGNALVTGLVPNPHSWKTGAVADNFAPTVTITNPAALATLVPVDKKINATFSEDMLVTTMINTNYTVKETLTGNNVAGTVAYDVQNKIATFSPTLSFTADMDYTATVSNGAQDLAKNALVVPQAGSVTPFVPPVPWTFRTAAATVPPVALAVNLRGAASFGIASRAGMTSTGVTVVNGDVALSPTPTCTDSTGNAGASQTCLTKTYSSPTGMTVNGSIYYFGDPFDNGGTANSVSNDLQIAWNEGLAKTNTMGTVAADQLGGKTFLPGVYTNANLGLAAGLVATMDAGGDANAIFIFQVGGVAPAGDLAVPDSLATPAEIKLVNGAQARNVWFVVGRDITIGINTIWKGNILAGRDATIKNGAAVVGRVLGGASGAGAIVLTGAASPSVTTITVPH